MIRVLVLTSEFLFYYHCLSVYGGGLTALGIRGYVYEAPQVPIDPTNSAPQ
jgi:hypothetical protein